MSPTYSIIFFIFTIAAISSSCFAQYSDEEIERGDAYIDKLLHQLFIEQEEDYDPYKIEDSAIGFHRKIAFVNVSGEAKLYDGYIKGLKTLHRPDHCSLHEENNRLYVKADLGAGVLEFHYAGTVKFMNYGPSIHIDGELAYVEIRIEFSVNAKTGQDGKLHKFIIDDMRGMETRTSGLGPLTWAMSPIVNGASKLFKGYLRNFLERRVQKHLEKYIPDFQFPVEAIQTEIPTTVTVSTEEPIVETETPSPENPDEETENPDKETEKPDEETEKPDEETEKPDEETEKPDEETESPDEETESPDEETESPDEETESPDEETESPDEQNEKPNEETENPDEETEGPDEITETA